MKLYTAKQVADQIGCQKSTVHRWAKALQCGIMLGQQRVFTKQDADLIRKSVRPASGNPNWRRKK